MVNAVHLTTAFYEFEHVVYSPVMFSLVIKDTSNVMPDRM